MSIYRLRVINDLFELFNGDLLAYQNPT